MLLQSRQNNYGYNKYSTKSLQVSSVQNQIVRRDAAHVSRLSVKPTRLLVVNCKSKTSAQEENLDYLTSNVKEKLKGRNIYLIGMMGSGKSTIGKLLAKRAEFEFRDTDHLVEESNGMPIPSIFEKFGEETFRSSETRVLRDLSLAQDLVVSTGGGAILRAENWTHLRTGCVCWLDGTPELLARRVERDGYDKRPLLANKTITDREELFRATVLKIRDIFEKRRTLYEQAHVRISVAAKPTHDSAESATPEEILIRLLSAILDRKDL